MQLTTALPLVISGRVRIVTPHSLAVMTSTTNLEVFSTTLTYLGYTTLLFHLTIPFTQYQVEKRFGLLYVDY